MKKIDRLLTSRAIQHVYTEITGRDPKLRTQVQLGGLYSRLRKLLPSEQERSRRLKDAADNLLPQVIEETVKQLRDVNVVDLQFEAGDIARLYFSGNTPPEGINPDVHGRVLEELAKAGRLVKM